MAFCLGMPGLNPGKDLIIFQFRIAANVFLLGIRLLTCKENIDEMRKNILRLKEKGEKKLLMMKVRP